MGVGKLWITPTLTPLHSLVYSETVFSIQKLSMYRVPAEKVCFLGPLSDNQKAPNVMIEELEKVGIALT